MNQCQSRRISKSPILNNLNQLRLNYARWCLLKVLSVLMSLLFGVCVNNAKLQWVIFTIALFDDNNTRIPIFPLKFPYTSIIPDMLKLKQPQEPKKNFRILVVCRQMMQLWKWPIDKTSKGSIITNYAVTQLPF